MVEANGNEEGFEDGFGEGGDDDGDGEGWDDYYEETEEDPYAMAQRIKKELENEKQIEENMRLIEEMRAAQDQLMDNKVAKLTKWKLISVKRFIALMKQELSEEQKVPTDQVDFSKLQEQNCSICYCELYEGIATMPDADVEKLDAEQKGYMKAIDVVQMSACKGHFFHAECLTNQLGEGQFLACANCNHFYGVLTGDQPKGQMRIGAENSKVAGYESSQGTWHISYSLQGGINPKTNVGYSGDGRRAFIPMCPEGDEVLALLQMAFARKLIFTVGFSPTRNQDNVICWNGIHHKTNMSGGSSSYGYPDETYLQRVKEELKLKGCFFESEQERTAAISKAKTTTVVNSE